MLSITDFSRELRRNEEGAVDALLRDAFDGTEEVALVQKLRKSRVIAGETVMPAGDQLIGYYALSYMVKPKGWLCLAPVAVHPDAQRKGYGKRMMGMLSEWARMTKTPIVVLGAPPFYEKCGFSGALAAELVTPFSLDHTMLAGISGSSPSQTLVYPAAFNV